MEALHHSALDMFSLTLPWFEKIARPVLVYLLLILLLRLFGKRELAQLNPYDLIVLLCLSNTLQNAIIGEDNSVTGGFLGAFALLAANYATVRLLFRHPRLEAVIEGTPTVLIDRGEVNPAALQAEILTLAELESAVHRQGFSGLDEIERCVLEPNGTFGIQPKASSRNPNAEILAKLESIERQLAQLATR